MKTGINLLLWTRKPSIEHIPLIHKIKSYGYDGIEFNVVTISDGDAHRLGKEAADLGLAVTAIAIIPHEAGDPASPDKAERMKAADWLKRCADTAKLLGSDVLGGPLTECLNGSMASLPKAEEVKWAAETLHAAAEYTSTTGVRLACEVINRYEVRLANTVDQMLGLVKLADMPNIGLHVDTYHGNVEESDICAAWRKAGDKVFLVHISENNRGIPGSGSAIRPEVFSTLKEIGYNGCAVIEAFFLDPQTFRKYVWRKYAENEEEIAVKGLAYIRRYW